MRSPDFKAHLGLLAALLLAGCGGSGGGGGAPAPAPEPVDPASLAAPFHADGSYLMPCTPLGFTFEGDAEYAPPGGPAASVKALGRMPREEQPPAPRVSVRGGGNPPATAYWREDRRGAALEIVPAAPLDPETGYEVALPLAGLRWRGEALSGELRYAIRTLSADSRGTWLFPVHYSQALQRERQFEIFLPPGHGLDPKQTYPTLYGYVGGLSLLDNFRTKDEIDEKLARKIASCEIEPMIFAVPDPHHLGPFEPRPGDTFFVAGDYNDWDDPEVDGREWYETYLVQEFPEMVERRWGARTDKWGRATTGYSHGGYGAAVLAFRHPERFGSTSPMSAFLSLRYLGGDPYVPPSEIPYWTDPLGGRLSLNDSTHAFCVGIGKSLGVTLERWMEHNPADVAEHLFDADFDGGILLATGDEDPYEILPHLRDTSRILAERGVRHMVFTTPDDGHNHGFWRKVLEYALPMHSRAFTGRLQPQGELSPTPAEH